MNIFSNLLLDKFKGQQNRNQSPRGRRNEEKGDPFGDEYEGPPLTGCSATSAVNNSQLNNSTGMRIVRNCFMFLTNLLMFLSKNDFSHGKSQFLLDKK